MWADSLSCTTELEVFAGWCFEAVNCLPLPPSPCTLVLFAIYPSQLLHLTVIWLPKEHGPKWLGTDSVLSQAAPTLCQVNYMKNISLVRWGLFISPSHLCWHQSGGCQQELVRPSSKCSLNSFPNLLTECRCHYKTIACQQSNKSMLK